MIDAISLDVTGITQPRTFKAQALGWPLRFTKDSTVFYNTQGLLMQLANAPIPGLFSINAGSSTNSDIAQYARHEFNTYFLQHAEHLPHATDLLDGNWHLNGARHIDHGHLILTIAGTVNSSVSAPGASPAFTLQLDAYSFFQNGLVGTQKISLNNGSSTDSYNARTGSLGANDDVLSNCAVTLQNGSTVLGNATGTSFSLTQSSVISGQQVVATQPTSFILVQAPTLLPNLGKVYLNNNATQTVGPGSYQLSSLTVANGSRLLIDNTTGPGTLYVTGGVSVNNNAQSVTTSVDPGKFTIYVAGKATVSFDYGFDFHGVVYALQSAIYLNNQGNFSGSFIGKSIDVNNGSHIHYDTALRGE